MRLSKTNAENKEILLMWVYDLLYALPGYPTLVQNNRDVVQSIILEHIKNLCADGRSTAWTDERKTLHGQKVRSMAEQKASAEPKLYRIFTEFQPENGVWMYPVEVAAELKITRVELARRLEESPDGFIARLSASPKREAIYSPDEAACQRCLKARIPPTDFSPAHL